MAGCASEPKTAAGAGSAARLGLTATHFEDTDGDGLRDTAGVVVYVFAREDPRPLRARGALEFVLRSRANEELERWRFTPDQTRALQGELPPGWAFVVSLRRRNEAAGPARAMEAELLCRFTPEDGGTAVVAAAWPLLQVGTVPRRGRGSGAVQGGGGDAERGGGPGSLEGPTGR